MSKDIQFDLNKDKRNVEMTNLEKKVSLLYHKSLFRIFELP